MLARYLVDDTTHARNVAGRFFWGEGKGSGFGSLGWFCQWDGWVPTIYAASLTPALVFALLSKDRTFEE